MESVAFEIILIFGLIMINGFLALSEMAIVSSNKLRLQTLANQGKSGSKTALKLLESPSDLLASVQVGITLVSLLVGAFGGSTIAEKLSEALSQYFPSLDIYADGIALSLVVATIGYFSLIIGELVPKRLALTNPEQMASSVARSIRLLSLFSRPAVRLLTYSTEFALRILNIDKTSGPKVTEEEVKLLVEQGTEAGVFEQGEETIIKRIDAC